MQAWCSVCRPLTPTSTSGATDRFNRAALKRCWVRASVQAFNERTVLIAHRAATLELARQGMSPDPIFWRDPCASL